MNNIITKRIIVTTIMIGSIVLNLIPTSNIVMAVGSDSNQGQSTTSGNSSTNRSDNSVTKLAAAKLKVCQNRKSSVNAIMARIADRSTKRIQLFEQIQTKVQTYYTEKNLSVVNYDELIANVLAKKATAQLAVQNENTIRSQFSCDGDNPKGVLAQFKTQQKSELGAINEYRTALKDLINSIKLVTTDGVQ